MAIVTFHSKASGSFILLSQTQKQIFEELGRECTPSGAISPEEAAEWIERLEKVLAREKVRKELEEKEHRQRQDRCRQEFRKPGMHAPELFAEEEQLEEKNMKQPVPLSARIYPLLEMLRKARDAGEMVMWGVP